MGREVNSAETFVERCHDCDRIRTFMRLIEIRKRVAQLRELFEEGGNQ